MIAPEGANPTSPVLVRRRPAESAALAIVLAFAALMAWDNWHTGIAWESTGPQAGYFPFYVSLILAGACTYGLAREVVTRREPSGAFVRRDQFKRVLQVFVPTLVFVPVTQWLGIYVASFLLIAGFMIWLGRLGRWLSLLTALVFTALMFAVFELAFQVIMPKGPLERMLGF